VYQGKTYGSYVSPNPMQDIHKYSKYIVYLQVAIPIVLTLGVILLLYTNSLQFLSVLILIFIALAIFNMIFTWKLGESFEEFAKVYPSAHIKAADTGKYLRYTVILNLLNAFIPSVGIVAIIFRIIAYYNIAETFKILKENGLFPKKESRLLFYGYLSSIIINVLIVSISFTMLFGNILAPKKMVNYLMMGFLLTIAFSILLTRIAQIIGLHKLSEDILLIKELRPTESTPYRYQTAYNQQPYQTYQSAMSSQPSQKYTNYTTYHPSTDKQSEQLKYCVQCGKRADKNANFCEFCGASLKV